MKKNILYITLPLMGILLTGVFYFYYHPNKGLIKAQVMIEKSELARLALNGTEIKLLTSTNDHSTSRNFLVLDGETGETITTLSVSSLGLWTPYYRIIKGNTHDWLVVTRLESWGTGMKNIYDEWYALDWQGTMKLVLFYPSETMLLDGSDGKNTYWRTEVINEDKLDDSAVNIKFMKQTCTINEDESDKDCVESANTLNYVWDEEDEEFEDQ